jgi:Lrp/AsnC family transcriptional regulator, leucine-responsive regulatory protein
MTKAANLAAQLDEFDLKILDALQENNQRTSEELADLVHLSPASCLRRARRLREMKAIVADVSLVAPEVIGPRMTMVVLVSFEREQHDLIDSFKDCMRADPQVTQCYYVTGSVDFVLFVSARDLSDYERFTQKFFFENRNVKKFETMVVMSCAKFDLSVRASVAQNGGL